MREEIRVALLSHPAKSSLFSHTHTHLSHPPVQRQALYDYTAGDDDELSFKAGEILRVTDEGATTFNGMPSDAAMHHLLTSPPFVAP